jgi:hypothetical protein
MRFRALDAQNPGDAIMVRTAQLELEFRRAGGPRATIVETLLADLHKSGSEEWYTYARRACSAGLIRCADLVGPAEMLAQRQSPPADKYAEACIESLQIEAAWEALPLSQRRDYYLQAIRTRRVGQGSMVPPDRVSLVDAVKRSLSDGLYADIRAEVERDKEGLGFDAWAALQGPVAAALASGGDEPVRALLELVRRGAEEECAVVTLMVQTGTGRAPLDDEAVSAARYAVPALRKLAGTGTLEGLKEIAALYSKAVAIGEEQRRQGLEAQEHRKDASPLIQDETVDPLTLMATTLWPSIAELIGDLGDREFERAALGGRCLWDQVHEVEVELVKRGKLKPEAMVSVETAARE